ncbi:MAG: CmcJ/NvfI family oxidoreductase [Burkholderiaceae bacterium]
MTTNATVNYHLRTEAKQAFHFDVDGINGNLVSPELVPTDILVRDLRKDGLSVEFDRDGIVFTHAPSRIKDFDDGPDWQARYEAELCDLLTEQVGAEEVIVFDHTVRIDDLDATRKPARNVHTDYSRAGAEQRLIDIVGADRARDFHNSGFGFVNVWRPIEHVITTSPLGFIRPATIEADDWMTIDLIYPDRRGEILGVAANPDHEWFYLSRMTPDEVVIFNIFDNERRPCVAHSALDTEVDSDCRSRRKSIESRTLVRYI